MRSHTTEAPRATTRLTFEPIHGRVAGVGLSPDLWTEGYRRSGAVEDAALGSLRLPTIAATGGMNMATTLITIAAVVEKNRTTNHAEMIRVRQIPISTK